MTCNGWKDEWVARLYDELDEREERELAEHLEVCAACRRTLDELEQARQVLQTSSAPVPAGPRVVVLRAPRLRQPAWAFASGLAAALLLFATGMLAGYRLPATLTGPTVTTAANELGSPVEPQAVGRADTTELEYRLAALERQVEEIDQADPRPDPTAALQAFVTPDQFDNGLRELERRLDAERARDVGFLLEEISATEWRAGRWVDDTRQMILASKITER